VRGSRTVQHRLHKDREQCNDYISKFLLDADRDLCGPGPLENNSKTTDQKQRRHSRAVLGYMWAYTKVSALILLVGGFLPLRSTSCAAEPTPTSQLRVARPLDHSRLTMAQHRLCRPGSTLVPWTVQEVSLIFLLCCPSLSSLSPMGRRLPKGAGGFERASLLPKHRPSEPSLSS
jgi:hypothetical protein